MLPLDELVSEFLLIDADEMPFMRYDGVKPRKHAVDYDTRVTIRRSLFYAGVRRRLDRCQLAEFHRKVFVYCREYTCLFPDTVVESVIKEGERLNKT